MNKLLNLTGRAVRCCIGNQPQLCTVLYDEAPMTEEELVDMPHWKWLACRSIIVSWMVGGGEGKPDLPYHTKVSRRSRKLEVLDE